FPTRVGEIEQTSRPLVVFDPLGIDEEDASAGGKGMPGVVIGVSRGRVRFAGRTPVRFQEALLLQPNRGEGLVVAMNIATRSIFFANQLDVQADRLVGFRVVFRVDLQTGALGELAQDLLREFLVLGTVEDDMALGVSATA